MRLSAALLATTLMFTACASEGLEDDEILVEEGLSSATTADKADQVGLPFGEFIDPLGVGSAADIERRQLITSASSYRRVLGHAPPSDINFTREWVVFYSAGIKATGGYTASVESITSDTVTRRLSITTQLVSPGAGCLVTQALTRPATLVRFKRPTHRPNYVRFHHDDVLNSCIEGQDVGETCGGIAALQCAGGLQCNYSNNQGCNIADIAGFCETIVPRFCPLLYNPVCGCDGNTYSSDCERRIAGVPLDHSGVCAPPGQGVGETCGGIAALQCASGLVCDYSAGNGCYPDMAGVCNYQVQVLCTQEYRPVCGCDNRTYSNDCMRRAALVALANTGACR